MGIRADIEEDLAETLEDSDDYGLPVVLIGPDGVVYDTSENDDDDLYGQVLYDHISQDEDGNQIIDNRPVVTLRISSLARVPQNGEVWAVKIPVSPLADAELQTFVMERAVEGGASIGFVRLYLRKAEQS
jgi:hypothetical protein